LVQERRWTRNIDPRVISIEIGLTASFYLTASCDGHSGSTNCVSRPGTHILYLLERHTLQTGIHVQRIRVGVRRFGRFGVLRSPSQERDHHSGNDKSEPDPKILSHG
jgi:hypothetical protein